MDSAQLAELILFIFAIVVMVLIVLAMLNVVEDSLKRSKDEEERERLNKVMGAQ